MHYVRFTHRGKPRYGCVKGGAIYPLRTAPWTGRMTKGPRQKIPSSGLLAPAHPSKIVAVGLNYNDHARELGMPHPKEPVIFMKPPSAVIGPGDTILLPAQSRRVDYEGELAIVIKKTTRNVTPAQSSRHIFGYTCMNDVTARDLQKKDVQWTRAKSFDTFCPLGPVIATGIDPATLSIRTYVNDVLCQDSSTARMIYPPAVLVSYISRIMTLYPGDIIATGTPAGIGPLDHGDTVRVVIEHIGELKNRVRRRECRG